MAGAGAGDEDVNDFLSRVRELGTETGTGGNHDDAKARQQEENLLKSRRERQARRAGRSSIYMSLTSIGL
jgi:hypothetical protein